MSDKLKDSLGFGDDFKFEDLPIQSPDGEWGFRVSNDAQDFSCAVRCSSALQRESLSKRLRLVVTSVFKKGHANPHGPASIDAQKRLYRFVHRLPEVVTKAIGTRLAIKGLPEGQSKREDFEEQFRFMNQLKRAWEENADAKKQAVLGICAPIAHIQYRQGQETGEFLLLPEIDAPSDERDKHVRHYTAQGPDMFSSTLYPELEGLAGGNTFGELAHTVAMVTGVGSIHDLQGYNIIRDVRGKFWLIDLHARSQVHRKGV